MRRARYLSLAATMLCAPLWAGEPATETSPASGAQVQIVDFMRFDPAQLTVAPGTTVTWTNKDGSNHVVQFADQKSPRMRHDATYSRRFDTPGEYAYQCAIHGERMRGTIIVR